MASDAVPQLCYGRTEATIIIHMQQSILCSKTTLDPKAGAGLDLSQGPYFANPLYKQIKICQ